MSDAEVNRLLGEAEAARAAGRGDEAVRALEAVLHLAPNHPQALNSLGLRALGRGDLTAAVSLLARAAAADPDEPALWMNLAHAQRKIGDDEGQFQTLNRLLSLDRRHFLGLLFRAQLNEKWGQHIAANHDWAAVLELAKGMEPPKPEVAKLLQHARAFVSAQYEKLGATLERELAASRAALDPDELRRFDACLDHQLGRREIYANRCFGLHFPFLPADEFFPRRHFPWFAELEAATDAIRAEFESLARERAEDFGPYVFNPPGTPENKWTPLHNNLDWSAYFLWKDGARREAECARCPATAAVLDKLPLAAVPNRAPVAFFSVLRAKSHIPPHTGVTNTRAIVHLPLIVPPGCRFRVGGETREWKVGEAFAFDDTIEHEAWNDSDEPRAVLILDVPNPHMTEAENRLVNEYYRAADAAGWIPLPGKS